MEAPPATGGVAGVGLAWEVAGLSAWVEGAPDARGGLCAWGGGFRNGGGGFTVVFVRAIAGTAKGKRKGMNKDCRKRLD